MASTSHKRKERIAKIATFSFLLVAMAVAVTVGILLTKGKGSDGVGVEGGGGGGGGGRGEGDHGGGGGGSIGRDSSDDFSTSVKPINIICGLTEYKEECETSLKTAGDDTKDPEELIKVEFQEAMKFIEEAGKNSTTWQGLETDPHATEALTNCQELLNNSISQLQYVLERVSEFDVTQMDVTVIEFRIWLTAVLANQETCLEGFEGSTSDAGDKMKEALNLSMKLSRNALAMVTSLSDFLISVRTGRRLLSDDKVPIVGHEPREEETLDFIPFVKRRRNLLSDDIIRVLGHEVIDGDMPNWVRPGTRRLLHGTFQHKPDVVVAKDASGQVKSIVEALKRVPPNNQQPFVIHIKEGVYEEYVVVEKHMRHVVFVGDGPSKTRIVGSRSMSPGSWTAMNCGTLIVKGYYFMAKDIGIENTAGPENGKAIALYSESEDSIFFNCGIHGYQDTLFLHSLRQFYRDCTISGTTDFIFGYAATVLQNCTIVVRKPQDGQNQLIITAQGRLDKNGADGIVIHKSVIKAGDDLHPTRQQYESYLGRPWKQFSRTVIIDTFIDDLIDPKGWLPSTTSPSFTDTCFFAEVNNKGPGSNKDKRVKWKGIENLDPEQALDFSVGKFLAGDKWLRRSGVTHISGL